MNVAIVGASIAGCYTAWKLAQQGHMITVFERNSSIGQKTCSGLVSERLWNFIPRNEKIIQNEISQAHVHFPKKTIELRFEPKMLVLDRRSLDRYVANLAAKAGAKFVLNSNVFQIFQFRKDKPQVSIQRGGDTYTHSFDAVIGADGALSVTRRMLRIPDPKFRLGILSYSKKGSKSDIVNIYPLKDGFAWTIPHGSRTEYGVIESVEKAKNYFDSFCRLIHFKSKDLHAALIPTSLVERTSRRNVVLLGDAAGLCKPWSGGGIIWGLTAADILLRTFPDFKKYSTEIKRFFEPRAAFSALATKAVMTLGHKFPHIIPSTKTIDSDWVF